jgi:hypothetical protein
MACEAEWDAYQLAISARIAAEIVEELAIEARQAAQMAEWTACMNWWYCGQQGMRAAVDTQIPSLAEAKAAFTAASAGLTATRSQIEQLKLEYQRVTGKPYEPK